MWQWSIHVPTCILNGYWGISNPCQYSRAIKHSYCRTMSTTRRIGQNVSQLTTTCFHLTFELCGTRSRPTVESDYPNPNPSSDTSRRRTNFSTTTWTQHNRASSSNILGLDMYSENPDEQHIPGVIVGMVLRQHQRPTPERLASAYYCS